MSSRFVALEAALAAAAVCGLCAACGNDDTASPATPATTVPAQGGQLDAATASTAGDAAACSAIYAKDQDRTCTTDSDCVSVPFGGNLCDPCSQGAECFQCSIASVNKGAADAYTTALRAAVGAAENANPGLECFIASCPLPLADSGLGARCVSGVCTQDEEGVAGCQ
jgi:hypothetical protein